MREASCRWGADVDDVGVMCGGFFYELGQNDQKISGGKKVLFITKMLKGSKQSDAETERSGTADNSYAKYLFGKITSVCSTDLKN